VPNSPDLYGSSLASPYNRSLHADAGPPMFPARCSVGLEFALCTSLRARPAPVSLCVRALLTVHVSKGRLL
jgi:hypothetical protein